MHPDLPGILADIAEIAGAHAAIAVAERLGGVRVVVRPGGDLWRILADVAGERAARRVVQRWRGIQVCIPVARRQRIAWMIRSGMRVAEIARAVGCSERTVQRVAREVRREQAAEA